MALFIVPPPCGCEWRISATGARGRGPGLKRPSRRPSGPGKITSGMGLGRLEGSGKACALYRSADINRNRQSHRRPMARIYLDHAATTPILPQARAAVAEAFERWANPSSPHAEGRAARTLLEEARSTIAEVLAWRHDVLFTSGASEAIEIVAKRATVRGRAHGATEHAIVPHAMG